jgi:hypothetical protein
MPYVPVNFNAAPEERTPRVVVVVRYGTFFVKGSCVLIKVQGSWERTP